MQRISRTYACSICLLRLIPAGGNIIIADILFPPRQTQLCKVIPLSLLIPLAFPSLSTILQLASSQMNGHYSLAISCRLTFKSIQSKPRKSGNKIKGQSGSRLLMIPMWLTPMTFLVRYTIHLCSLIFLAYQSWLISFRTRIISQVMMLTVTEPLPNQVDVVLISHGITASTLAISHMETLPYLKLCSIRVMATSMLSAHNFGVVIRTALCLLSLLLFQFHPPMSMMLQLFWW